MRAGHVGEIVVVHQIVATHVDQFGIRVAQYVLATLIHGDQREVQLVLGLEHVLLVRNLQQTGRAKGRAVGKECQRRFLCLAILAMQDLDATAYVQAQETRCIVQQATKAHREAALQIERLVRCQRLGQLHAGHVCGEETVPQQLALQLLAILGVHQLVHRLMHYVRLQREKEVKGGSVNSLLIFPFAAASFRFRFLILVLLSVFCFSGRINQNRSKLKMRPMLATN